MRFIERIYQITAGMALGLMLFSSCHSGYSVVSVEGSRIALTAALDSLPDSVALGLLAPYKQTVDSMMSPVVGRCARTMTREMPECELGNLIADILRAATVPYLGREADVGLIHKGGIRAPLLQGDITVGEIYEITPFDNALCIVTLSGARLRQLFEDVAEKRAEAVSGAKLVLSEDGKLLEATVGGKAIDEDKEYKLATLDYLAEGNDGMQTFEAVPIADKQTINQLWMRQIFVDYVREQTRKGKVIDAKKEGRITIRRDNP